MWELLSSPKLCPKMRPRDIVEDSHSHSRCSTVLLPLRHLLRKGFICFPILCKWSFRPVSRPITMDSCCMLMFSSLIALPCWGPSMRALECLQTLPDSQHSVCFLSIHSLIARLTTLYGRPSTGSDPVNGGGGRKKGNDGELALISTVHRRSTSIAWRRLSQVGNILLVAVLSFYNKFSISSHFHIQPISNLRFDSWLWHGIFTSIC